MKIIHNLKRLNWDSNFFNKNVYSLKSSSQQDILFFLNQLEENSLVYVFSDREIASQNTYLVDKKITFEINTSSIKKEINEYPCTNYKDVPFSKTELELLAIEASKYSRFRTDLKIENQKVDLLYKEWIDKAISNPNEYEIIGIIRESRLIGMIVIKTSPSKHQIELIAVNEKYQKNGYGKILIEACFQNALTHKIAKISVITQQDNLVACNFYTRLGFIKNDIKYIYHFHK